MGLFDALFGRNSPGEVTRRITSKDPLVIKSPKIGFLNLMGEVARPIMDEDRSNLAGLFSGEACSEVEPPSCDVLFVYARVQNDGLIEGSGARLRDIINNSSASIVVFASENDPKGYIAAGRQPRSRNANLVLTIERKGKVFGTFFAALFGLMKSGVTMPMAWVQLAPQNPGITHIDCPSAIFSAEISHIIFQ